MGRKKRFGRFLWHENTTSLPVVSGAPDAGAEAPNAARRSCPRSPAAQSGQVPGTAKAGRRASALTL